MMQIVHDVGPGASLSFYSGYHGQEDFAEGILQLAADGAKIIVDDLRYNDEPVFENGVVAKAVRDREDATKTQAILLTKRFPAESCHGRIYRTA